MVREGRGVWYTCVALEWSVLSEVLLGLSFGVLISQKELVILMKLKIKKKLISKMRFRFISKIGNNCLVI